MNNRMKEGEKFARKCNATNEGMNEGFCFCDGIFNENLLYFKYKKDAIKQAKKQGYKNLEDSYNDENHFFTTWYEDEDMEYIFKNGKLIEITN